ARAAREVAERGRPDPEGADFRQFAGLLVRFMESEPDAVSIGSLYYNDSGPHIVSRGVPAARPSTLGRLELVSHGEHLRQAADSLERWPLSSTASPLRFARYGRAPLLPLPPPPQGRRRHRVRPPRHVRLPPRRPRRPRPPPHPAPLRELPPRLRRRHPISSARGPPTS